MLTPYEVLWLFVVPAALFSWYHLVRNLTRFIVPARKLPDGPQPKIIFQIAARSTTPILQESVDSIRRSCVDVGFSNYTVKVVVDSIGNTIDGAETVLVPKSFICMSRFKARALHYALRFLPNSKDVWILHLDEDALVTSQCVTSIINYIQRGGNPVANGPSIFPYDGNLLTFYAESQRQWTFFWLMDQEKSSTVHWLNGSNLLIRSDIEQVVGWDFINCFISEDARFGYEATKKLGKIFGWHGGLTIEAPPGTVKGLMKQRMRWFFGSILNLRYVPRGRLPRRLYSITAWVDGLILTTFLFAFLLSDLLHVNIGLRFSHQFIVYALLITGVLWLLRYQVGVYQNLRFSSLSTGKKLLLHLGIIPLAPVVDFLCALPTVLALIKPPRGFEITAKRG